MNAKPFAAACLLLGACATSPKLSFSEQLASDTATLNRLTDRMERAYGDVIELWESGWVGGPCVRMSEQGDAVRQGAAIIDRLTKQEAAVRRDDGGPAALEAAADFAEITDRVITLKDQACQYQ